MGGGGHLTWYEEKIVLPHQAINATGRKLIQISCTRSQFFAKNGDHLIQIHQKLVQKMVCILYKIHRVYTNSKFYIQLHLQKNWYSCKVVRAKCWKKWGAFQTEINSYSCKIKLCLEVHNYAVLRDTSWGDAWNPEAEVPSSACVKKRLKCSIL